MTRALLLLAALLPSLAFAQLPPAVPALGFPNVAQTPGQLLSPRMAPTQGRTAIIAFHNNVLVTIPEVPSSEPGSDFLVRHWNITNPAAPIQIATFGVTPMPVMAHGYFFVMRRPNEPTVNGTVVPAGAYLVMGGDFGGNGGPWSFLAEPGVAGLNKRTSGASSYGVRGDLSQPWFVTPSFWSYNAIGGNVRIVRGEPSSPPLGEFDHLGLTGVIGHPFLLGNILYYVSDQSRTGIAAYDISDPANVVLLDVLTTGGPGGYWPELWAGGGRLYAVMPYQTEGNGMRIADITDPTDLRFVEDVPLPGDPAMYAQFQDEFGFIGQHKVDMRTRRSVLQFEAPAPSQPLDTSQFALPIGNLLVTGGIGTGQGAAIWAHQAAPDLRAPEVAYHIPRAGQANYPRTAPVSLIIHETLDTTTINAANVRVCAGTCPASGGGVNAAITFSFDDQLTITPDVALAVNTTYEVRIDRLRDAAQNEMPAPYRFTFATGAAVTGNLPPVVSAFTATPYPVAPAANATFSATASDPNGGDTLQYRFDFGDGTPQTAWGAATNAQHAYATAGHYRATVQVRDNSNVIASRGTVVTVLNASASTPSRSSSIACHAPGRRVWSVNPDADTVAEINADTLAVVREITVCDDPRSLARSQQGEIWVTCHDGDAIAVINEASGAIAATLPTGYGSAPHGVAISPDGLTAYVTLQTATGGALRRFSTATRAQTGQLVLGANPRAIAVAGDGSRALVSRFLSTNDFAEVWDVNTAGGMSLANPPTVRVNKFGGDENRDTTASGKGVANQLAGIAFNPLDGRAWFAANKPNNERGQLIVPALDLDSDNSVRDLVVQINPNGATPAERVLRSVDLDNSDSASAVAFSPLGDYLLVALQGNDELLVLDMLASSGSTGLGGLVGRFVAGGAPQGVCVDATTRRTFVQDLMGRSVTALDTNALFTTGSLAVPTTEIDTVASEPLPANVLEGKRIFYRASDLRMSAEGYISCATCHLDGGHDGRVWDFTGRGEGLRNTVTLQGRGGTAHGNVHWSANFDEIQDFEGDMRLFFGGTGFMSDANYNATAAPLGAPKAGLSAPLDALAAYVTSLGTDTVPRSPFRDSATGALTAQGLAGQAVFAARGCATCHAAPRFTDSTVGAGTLRDVGTLRATSGGRLGGPLTGIDTPTLFGAWQTAPYFHDGSAPTLTDVFRVTGGTVVAGESGVVSGSAFLVNGFVDLNNDDTVRGRAYVQLDQNGGRVTFSGVNGGPGGAGAVEVRYSNSTFNPQLRLIVNGVTIATLPVPNVGNDPFFRSTNWTTLRFENVPLNAGATNTVVFETTGYYVAVDEIVVSHAGNLAAAVAHRTVLAAPAPDQAALIAYLQQLDRPAQPPADTVFVNGFE